MDSVPYANFQESTRSAILDGPAEVTVSVRHPVAQPIHRPLKATGRVQLARVNQCVNPSLVENAIQ
jgi:hypothetical protein